MRGWRGRPGARWSARATPHSTPGPHCLAGGSCPPCQGRWRSRWPPDKGSSPAPLVGVDVSMAAQVTLLAKWALQRQGGVTKATPTLGDTVRLVAELAWLGLRPPWAGQAGQRAIVLGAASCMAASHRRPQGLHTQGLRPGLCLRGHLPTRALLGEGGPGAPAMGSPSARPAPGACPFLQVRVAVPPCSPGSSESPAGLTQQTPGAGVGHPPAHRAAVPGVSATVGWQTQPLALLGPPQVGVLAWIGEGR